MNLKFPGHFPHRVTCPTGSTGPSSARQASLSNPESPDLAELAERTRSGLITLGILSPFDKIMNTWSHWLEHGYPTPFLGRDSVLRELLPALKSMGILSRGRFGASGLERSNQDHAYYQGIEAADYILEGRTESLINC